MVGPNERPLAAVSSRAFAIAIRKDKRAAAVMLQPVEWLAEWTGLEPATPGVTGRYSNQLNYRSYLVGAESLELPTFAL